MWVEGGWGVEGLHFAPLGVASLSLAHLISAALGSQEFPWWGDLQSGHYHNWLPALLPAHPLVRNTLPYILKPLAAIGLIPADVPRAAELMNTGGDGLSLLGKHKAITPQYFIGAIKPAA